MNLFCPKCEEHTEHNVTTWQTAAGKRGALSTLCGVCIKMEIHVLGEGHELKFEDEEKSA